VQAEANLQAFELGRRVAHDPSLARAAEDHTPTPETMPLDELIAHRTRELTAYQDAAYAKRYADQVARVAAVEAPLGSDKLTRAVAVNLYKLMAYKDEYEVARLYTDGRFAQERNKAFKGGKTKILLSPPLIAPKGPDGKPKKIEFSGWMLETAFPIMAKMKGLRGGPLDIFGRTEERRMERGLIASYEAGLSKLLAGLNAERLSLATQIAQVPQGIRGFGHIKDASVKVAKAEEAKLWAKWEA
jgi:indolepyruvate ferredoxin oxidoreductase